MVAALAAGASTAMLASGAGTPHTITLEATPANLLSLRGSPNGEDVKFFGTAPQTITFDSDESVFTNMRTGCTTFAPVHTTGQCADPAIERIEVNMRAGGDKVSFPEGFDSPGVKFSARGGVGQDRLTGSDEREVFDGGDGADRLRGKGGNDDLDGGKGRDDCEGGRGDDDVRNCE